jgi:hypothetical protein
MRKRVEAERKEL